MEDRSCPETTHTRGELPFLPGRNVHVRSFGCALNRADSLRLERLIQAQGGRIVREEEAEAVVVNTCTVVRRTEREVMRFLRRNADKELYLMGCMAILQEATIRTACQPVILTDSILNSSTYSLSARVNEAIGLVPIARGCDRSCTYCIAQRARGRLRSEPLFVICRAVKELAEAGVREIQITAQDVSAWGMDTNNRLPFLLDSILSLPGPFRLRLGMMNPATLIPIADQLLPLYRHHRMYAFAHIPVQSGSDPILQKMGRGYCAQDFLHLVSRLRKSVPGIWIATDVIAGFPGETEEDFAQTLDLIGRIRPNKVNITRFSSRPGTVAATFPDTLERIKKDRSRRLSRLADRICLENNHPWIGREVEGVAVERIKTGTIVCRTPEYRSVVIQRDLPLGSNVRIRITGARVHYLTGTLLS
jgi:threonylcarbamoyladenosine tRNA methylthiotransferase CDKAL1